MRTTVSCHIKRSAPIITFEPLDEEKAPDTYYLKLDSDKSELNVFCSKEQALQIAQVILEVAQAPEQPDMQEVADVA